MNVIKAPQPVNFNTNNFYVFLGGSIEQGHAEHWQKKLEEEFKDETMLTIINPRRDDWDSSWAQTKDNKQFREQVEWELSCQEQSHLNIYYFVVGTKSPITLLELGLFRGPSLPIVYCPDGFWRKGNVDIVCERYGIPQAETYEDLVKKIREELFKHKKYYKDVSSIPAGDSCAGCIYWELEEGIISDINGYCHYLRKGDWMNKKYRLTNQVKACNKNCR